MALQYILFVCIHSSTLPLTPFICPNLPFLLYSCLLTITGLFFRFKIIQRTRPETRVTKIKNKFSPFGLSETG